MSPQLLLVCAVILVTGGLFALYVRNAPHLANQWHVDPDEEQRRGKPNRLLLAGPEATSLPASPAELARLVEEVALSDPQTRLLAGSSAEGWMTFLTVSRVMKYPDYSTFKIVEGKDGRALLSVFARARFGHRDFGVNRKRIDAWLLEVKARLG